VLRSRAYPARMIEGGGAVRGGTPGSDAELEAEYVLTRQHAAGGAVAVLAGVVGAGLGIIVAVSLLVFAGFAFSHASDVPEVLWPAGIVALVLGVLAGWGTLHALLPADPRAIRVRLTRTGPERVTVRARGWNRVLALRWDQVIAVRLDDGGDTVLARTTTGDVPLAYLGTRQERTELVAALRRRLERTGPLPPQAPSTGRRVGATPAPQAPPPGWRVVELPPTGEDGVPATLLHRPPDRGVILRALAGVVVALVLALGATMNGGSSPRAFALPYSGLRFGAVLVLFGGGWVTYQLRWARQRTPGLLVRPGRLAVGVVDPRSGAWQSAAQQVVELRLEWSQHESSANAHTSDGYRLIAVLESGRRRTVDEHDGGGTLRELGEWLAEITGVPLADAVPG